jgi:hypothetical protein
MAERNDSTGPKSEERRDSPRVPMNFMVRRAGSDASYEPREGDLSLGGCAFKGTALEPGTGLEVRFRLPNLTDELKVRGEVLTTPEASQGGPTRVRFLDLPVEVELSIARHLDETALGAPKR